MPAFIKTCLTFTNSGAVKALKLRQLFKFGTESEILHEVSPDYVDSYEKWCPTEST